MKLNNKGKVGVVVLIILLVIALIGSLGYISYDKFIKTTSSTVKKESKEENNSKEETLENDSIVSNYYEFNNKVKYTGLCDTSESPAKEYVTDNKISINVSIPKIDIDKPGANNLNKLIQDKFKQYTNYNDSTGADKPVTIEYKYLVYKDYLFINIRTDISGLCSSGGVLFTDYYYDIKHDKVLTTVEAFNAADITLDELNIYVRSSAVDQIINNEDYKLNYDSFNECDNNKYGCGIEITENNRLIPYVNEPSIYSKF